MHEDLIDLIKRTGPARINIKTVARCPLLHCPLLPSSSATTANMHPPSTFSYTAPPVPYEPQPLTASIPSSPLSFGEIMQHLESHHYRGDRTLKVFVLAQALETAQKTATQTQVQFGAYGRVIKPKFNPDLSETRRQRQMALKMAWLEQEQRKEDAQPWVVPLVSCHLQSSFRRILTKWLQIGNGEET